MCTGAAAFGSLLCGMSAKSPVELMQDMYSIVGAHHSVKRAVPEAIKQSCESLLEPESTAHPR